MIVTAIGLCLHVMDRQVSDLSDMQNTAQPKQNKRRKHIEINRNYQ